MIDGASRQLTMTKRKVGPCPGCGVETSYAWGKTWCDRCFRTQPCVTCGKPEAFPERQCRPCYDADLVSQQAAARQAREQAVMAYQADCQIAERLGHVLVRDLERIIRDSDGMGISYDYEFSIHWATVPDLIPFCGHTLRYPEGHITYYGQRQWSDPPGRAQIITTLPIGPWWPPTVCDTCTTLLRAQDPSMTPERTNP